MITPNQRKSKGMKKAHLIGEPMIMQIAGIGLKIYLNLYALKIIVAV